MKIDQFLTCDVRRRLDSGSGILTAHLAHDPSQTPRALLIIKQFATGLPRSTTLRGQGPADPQRFVADGCCMEHTMRSKR